MKNLFYYGPSVKEMDSAVTSLIHNDAGVPGIALTHGSRGLGKTRTGIHLAGKTGSLYFRAKTAWSPTWMLEEIAVDLGISPKSNMKYLFDSVTSALKDTPRLIIVDEANLPEQKCLNTLRDLHDISGSPLMLIGHEGIVQRLKRIAPLFDRILYIVEVKPFTLPDLVGFAGMMLDIPATEEALARVIKLTGGNIRKCVVVLKGMENRAKGQRAKEIGVEHLPRGN